MLVLVSAAKSRVEHLRCDWALLCKDFLVVHQGLFRLLLWLCANMKVERERESQLTSMLSRELGDA